MRMGPQAKRRKVASKVEEINFDAADRESFLTGFRKRKQQRIKHAQEVAIKKAKEMKREERKRPRLIATPTQIREERTAGFQRAIEEHQRQLKKLQAAEDGSDGSELDSQDEDLEDQDWEGFAEPPAVDYEAEYIDEDKYTTVTVEEMDTSKEGLLRSAVDESDKNEESEAGSKATADPNPSAEPSKKRKADSKPKKKKKKFRYESKEERKVTRMKERASKSRKANARRERS
ncbi:hypothetical protein ASPACDRAFT_1884891 [Aspergillus aculeatus ATCC 16872]|uniref:Ribosomal RNA-processing protein 17 n=1 Tax=Aspergillus aculeatus (strain ATCC 16872 / CBS 172.66 / WB 5094) TaxID=690307 RepID=A0A1L9XA79_ASPA1|nr:uncharacterized protein ASPACDRAFT_1884891 [Aspergillus aculeatus ATCC 16872]OJK05332.1 hypothetical protein ASPACDRAFT_1884891 [Aspergillus aculeatus ATCC 16872]